VGDFKKLTLNVASRKFWHTKIGHHFETLAGLAEKEKRRPVTKAMRRFFPGDDYLLKEQGEMNAEGLAELLTGLLEPRTWGVRLVSGSPRHSRGWVKPGEIGGQMKTTAAIFLLSCCSCCAFGQDKAAVSAAEAACGPRDVGFKVTADKSRHPTPAPENGKALMYVVQKDDATTRVGAAGKWLGAMRRRTYFSASIEPGEHHLCAIGRIGIWSHVSLHELNAKAGETYYFVTEYGELVGDQFTLHQVDPDEGKYLVAWAHLSTFHPK